MRSYLKKNLEQVCKPEEIIAVYRGWMLFCPIYFIETTSKGPLAIERNVFLIPLMFLAECLQCCYIWVMTQHDPYYEPMFAFKVEEKPFWSRYDR